MIHVLRILLPALCLAGCIATSTPRLTADAIEGKLELGVPDGWGFGGRSPDDYDMFIDTQLRHGGKASVSLLTLETVWQGSGTLQQQLAAVNYAGYRVRFRAFVRTNRVEGSCALWMRADSESQKRVAYDDMARRRINGTNEWKEYSIVLDIPEDAVLIIFGIVLYGIGQVWIDDCKLETVGRDVATTGDYTRPTPAHIELEPDVRNVPVNLDFEGAVQQLLFE